MIVTRWFWVSVIASTLLMSGVLLSYYWFTGNWSYWSPWMLTVPVIGGFTLASFWLHTTHRELGQRLAYYLGLTFAALSIIAVVIGMIAFISNPDALMSTPLIRNISTMVHDAINNGINRGIRSIPDVSLRDLFATPTLVP
jgi:hypothetical protein